VKTCVEVSKLAAQRLSARRHVDLEERSAPVREAMIAAMVRLDWREARRQAEVLQSMGAGARGPITEAEQIALVAKLRRLIAEAQARTSTPEQSGFGASRTAVAWPPSRRTDSSAAAPTPSNASHCVMAGYQLREVQVWMGHSTITVTGLYAHLAQKRRAASSIAAIAYRVQRVVVGGNAHQSAPAIVTVTASMKRPAPQVLFTAPDDLVSLEYSRLEAHRLDPSASRSRGHGLRAPRCYSRSSPSDKRVRTVSHLDQQFSNSVPSHR
jgi:hypothetical protein